MRSVIVVDDQLAFRSATRRSLAGSPFDLIGEAASAEEGIELIARIHPDIVIMDVRLPGMDGIAAARLLALNADHPDVVLVSTYGIEDLPDLEHCGARGFVAKVRFGPDALASVIDPKGTDDTALSTEGRFTAII